MLCCYFLTANIWACTWGFSLGCSKFRLSAGKLMPLEAALLSERIELLNKHSRFCIPCWGDCEACSELSPTSLHHCGTQGTPRVTCSLKSHPLTYLSYPVSLTTHDAFWDPLPNKSLTFKFLSQNQLKGSQTLGICTHIQIHNTRIHTHAHTDIWNILV